MDRGESRSHDSFQWPEVFGAVQSATNRISKYHAFIYRRADVCRDVLLLKLPWPD
jgi:hypothetical protein